MGSRGSRDLVDSPGATDGVPSGGVRGVVLARPPLPLGLRGGSFGHHLPAVVYSSTASGRVRLVAERVAWPGSFCHWGEPERCCGTTPLPTHASGTVAPSSSVPGGASTFTAVGGSARAGSTGTRAPPP